MNSLNNSWNKLKPNDSEQFENDNFEDYYERIIKDVGFSHIPKPVFKQWIYPHHQNDETLKNYSWIDYSSIQFELISWDFDSIKNVNVINEYLENRVFPMSKLTQWSDFNMFKPKDIDNWKIFGTWRVPPIILDVNSLGLNQPESIELREPYQLVEGHTRLGLLNSMKTISDKGNDKIADYHKIYLMKKVRMHNTS